MAYRLGAIHGLHGRGERDAARVTALAITDPEPMNSIVMILSCHALGELLVRNLYLCALSRHFPSSPVYAVVDPHTPEQAMSLLLNPHVDYMLIADRMSSKFWADMYWLRGEWEMKRNDLARPMLFVPPNLMYLGKEMFALDHPDPWKVNYLIFGDMVDATLFAIPPQIAVDSERQLLALGLDRDKWFTTLHIREDGYRVDGYRSPRSQFPLHPRSVAKVERYVAAIDYIIAKGGQVVRLGDPTMTQLPPRKGFVDLAQVRNSFLLQAYACSRSRFLLGGDSGPSVIATGFNTPAAAVNMVNAPVPMTVPKNHVLATKGFRLDDGRVVWDRDAESLELMTETAWYERVQRLEELSENELCRVCEVMLARTDGVSGWVEREPSPADFWAGERRISAADIERRMSWQRIYLSDISPRQL